MNRWVSRSPEAGRFEAQDDVVPSNSTRVGVGIGGATDRQAGGTDGQGTDVGRRPRTYMLESESPFTTYAWREERGPLEPVQCRLGVLTAFLVRHRLCLVFLLDDMAASSACCWTMAPGCDAMRGHRPRPARGSFLPDACCPARAYLLFSPKQQVRLVRTVSTHGLVSISSGGRYGTARLQTDLGMYVCMYVSTVLQPWTLL